MMTVANDRARVAQNDETIENLKRNRRQDKQIDRRDAVDPTAMNIFDTRPDPSYGTGAIAIPISALRQPAWPAGQPT
jgi:hypothetical protein